MLSKYPIFSLLILSMIFACGKPHHFMDYRNFEGHWPALKKVVFDIDAPSDQPVNMMIYIRNNRQYPFSNLFLIARLKREIPFCFAIHWNTPWPMHKASGWGKDSLKSRKANSGGKKIMNYLQQKT